MVKYDFYNTEETDDCAVLLLDQATGEPLDASKMHVGALLTSIADELDCDAIQYATISSYLGDYAFNSDKCESYPRFTRDVVLFWLSAFGLRPLCCAIFFMYYLYFYDSRLIILGSIITTVFYGTLVLEIYLMYRNMKRDEMPLNKIQQIIVGILATLGPIIFVVISYMVVFTDAWILDKLLSAHNESRGYIVYLAMIACLVYGILSISDAIGFVFPRLWVKAVFKTIVPF
uniref:UL20 integral membrane protein n=1 Tax=Meleagrid herpesvirus 1 TaxID=37108 RepID=Q9E1H2_MEHV1|nr:UL20 integral membrane protein [Meleagrid alphaherpesvirus 1]